MNPINAPLFSRFEHLIRPLWLFFITTLLITTLSRMGLMLWQGGRFEDLHAVLTVLVYGLRIDLSAICYWLFPAVLACVVTPGGGRAYGVFSRLLRVWLVVGVVLFAFMEAATPGFIQQYDLRPNRLFVEYLQYPKEVFSMLVGGFLPALILGTVVLLASPILGWKLFARLATTPPPKLRWWQRLGALLVLLVVVFLGARGTLQHRPINPSYTSFSPDPLVNNLTLNSAYSVAFAIKAMRGEIDASTLYPALSEAEVFAEVRHAMGVADAQFTSAQYPTLHRQPLEPTALPHFKNLVIVLEESLGAQYVGTLGGLPLTPEIDALAEQGWMFDQLYATGTRSVRGIEAVVTGFVPTPARAVVKLPRSQRNFFTLAALLRERGYDTSFIYGGEAHFDNMASFFLGNGFTRIVDERDYVSPRFIGSWGASDEDLLDKADELFTRLHNEGKPFFSLVFSSSNHTPYEYPVGSVAPLEQPDYTRNNAIHYADHAVGQFFRKARQANYWDDTLFLIVADHDDRAFGREFVPIEHFHIPALLLGKGLPARRDSRMFSQLDLPPTLLALLGIGAEHPMIGQDITRLGEDYIGRTIMQYDQYQAYRRGDRVVILQPQRAPLHFSVDPETYALTPAEFDPALAKEAIAHALWGAIAYKRGLYPAPVSH